MTISISPILTMIYLMDDKTVQNFMKNSDSSMLIYLFVNTNAACKEKILINFSDRAAIQFQEDTDLAMLEPLTDFEQQQILDLAAKYLSELNQNSSFIPDELLYNRLEESYKSRKSEWVDWIKQSVESVAVKSSLEDFSVKEIIEKFLLINDRYRRIGLGFLIRLEKREINPLFKLALKLQINSGESISQNEIEEFKKECDNTTDQLEKNIKLIVAKIKLMNSDEFDTYQPKQGANISKQYLTNFTSDELSAKFEYLCYRAINEGYLAIETVNQTEKCRILHKILDILTNDRSDEIVMVIETILEDYLLEYKRKINIFKSGCVLLGSSLVRVLKVVAEE